VEPEVHRPESKNPPESKMPVAGVETNVRSAVETAQPGKVTAPVEPDVTESSDSVRRRRWSKPSAHHRRRRRDKRSTDHHRRRKQQR
jgi:hypothetical protein